MNFYVKSYKFKAIQEIYILHASIISPIKKKKTYTI